MIVAILTGFESEGAAVPIEVATGETDCLGRGLALGDLDVLEVLNAGDAVYYDLSGQRISELQTGVNIVKRGNKTCKVILTQGR